MVMVKLSDGAMLLLESDLLEDEGLRLSAYRDSLGNWTIGVGHLLPGDLSDADASAMRITLRQAGELLESDIRSALADASTFPWFRTLDDVRQAVVVNLCFNLGLTKFREFVKTIAAIQNREYAKASKMLLQSRWAEQVGPTRSGRLARMLETGRAE